jgi:hypothetical protein
LLEFKKAWEIGVKAIQSSGRSEVRPGSLYEMSMRFRSVGNENQYVFRIVYIIEL